MIRLVRAELLKLRSLRLFHVALLLAAAFAVLSTVAGIEGSNDPGDEPLTPTVLLYIVASPYFIVSGIVLVLGIVAMTGEFRHATVTQTFLTTPQRGRVVVAKLGSLALVGLLFSAIASAVALAVGIPMLTSNGVELTFSAISGTGLERIVAGELAATALFGVAGIGLGALLRNQSAAIGSAMTWLMGIEGILIGVLRAPEVLKWLPGGAAAALSGAAMPGPNTLSMWTGGAVFAAYGIGLALLGTLVVVRRDVS